MDVESLHYLDFCGKISVHLRNLYITINILKDDVVLSKNAIETLEEDKAIIKKLKMYKELVKDLTDFLNFLEKNNIQFVKNEENKLIDELKDFINELNGNSEHFDLFYSKDFVVKRLYHRYYQIIVDADDVVQSIGTKINSKLNNILEILKFDWPDFDKEIEFIKQLFNKLIQKINNEKSKEFIKAAKISFMHSLTQFDHSVFSTVYLSEEFKDQRMNSLYSYLTSCLFLLVSTYDKIIFSIAIYLGSDLNENEDYIDKAFSGIKEKNKEFYESIKESDRQKEIIVARNIRNGFTHRIIERKPREINGYLISLILETRRIMELYNRHLIS